MKSFGNLIMGAILGGLVGGGIGLLLAPKAGRALRNDINDYANNLKSEVKRAAQQRRVELETELEQLREPTPQA